MPDYSYALIRTFLVVTLLLIVATPMRAMPPATQPADEAAPDLSEEALDARIESLRKGDFTVRLLDAAGNPVKGEAEYELKRHRFWFGTALNPAALFGNDKIGEEDVRKYRETFLAYFDHAVAEGGHRWANMEREARGKHTDQRGLDIYQWCEDNEIPIRGHHVFWEPNDKKVEWMGKGATRESDVKHRMNHLFDLYRGKIIEWDLNNEILRYRDYHKVDNADLFKWAKQIYPEGVFYLNEHPIITRFMGGPQYEKYVELIDSLLAEGAPVGGLGVQGHFGEDTLDPELVWHVYETLGKYDLPIKVTEYDNTIKDEKEQARQMRHFLKLSFAHPKVEGVLLWGFWGGRHWMGERAALWRENWSIKPAGQVWVDLMTRDWHTAGKATLRDGGSLSFRGFYGEYDVTADGHHYRVVLAPDATTAEVRPVEEAPTTRPASDARR